MGDLLGVWVGDLLGECVGVVLGTVDGVRLGMVLGADDGVRLGTVDGAPVAIGVPPMHTQTRWCILLHDSTMIPSSGEHAVPYTHVLLLRQLVHLRPSVLPNQKVSLHTPAAMKALADGT